MAAADIETLIARLGEILEGQAALTTRLTEAMERMAVVVAKHERMLQQRQCRCHDCKAFEPVSYSPDNIDGDLGPAVSR